MGKHSGDESKIILTSKDPLWLRNAARGFALQQMGDEIVENAINNLRCKATDSAGARCTKDVHGRGIQHEVNDRHHIDNL